MTDPAPDPPAPMPSAAVGIVCLNAQGDVCLIRRGQPPMAGAWSLPGGRIEWGEEVRAAALRELLEETGLVGTDLALLDVVDGLFHSRTTGEITRHYVLIDFLARSEGTPIAATDAADARWFSPADLETLDLWTPTRTIINQARRQAGFAH